MELDELRRQARDVVDDPTLTQARRRHLLASLAEDSLEPLVVSAACAEAVEKQVVRDLDEGRAPRRPRTVLPDYAALLQQGSPSLALGPAHDLDEALAMLLIAYTRVPTATGRPVWLGDLGSLLEPYVDGVDGLRLHRVLRQAWISLDRMLADVGAHADLGPDDGRVARLALRLARELRQGAPHLTLEVDPARTPDSLVRDARESGVASRPGPLPVGGGTHTLVRLDLREVALRHRGHRDAYLDELVPQYVELATELMETRIRHLVEDARFFEGSWLVADGLLHLDRYAATLDLHGLVDAVSLVLEHEGTAGHDTAADELAGQVVARVQDLVAARPMPHCEGSGGRALLLRHLPPRPARTGQAPGSAPS